MGTRRSFLAGAAGAGLVVAAFREDALVRAVGAEKDAGRTPACELARDEDYWGQIQRCFDTDRTVINFNNGGVCPTPGHVLDQMIRDLRFTNESPVQHMWRVLEPRVESVRRGLADEFGCDPEEIAITRNASEAMETLIFGIDLDRGDEVIITDQNYPRMVTSWEQRARREGIVVKKISFPIPLPSPEAFVERIRVAITPKTKVIEFPQVTNLSGQVLPVRDVVRLGREKGIAVFIDGAHAFAHLPFRRDDLDCDYYGATLHKWVMAPHGTGFLYVRREKVTHLWPLMAPTPEIKDHDIRKFEQIGTHPAANHNAAREALAFHEVLGTERKAARLRYLRDRWARRLSRHPRVRLLTDLRPEMSCGLGTFAVEGMSPFDLAEALWDRRRIFVTAFGHEEFSGVRVTPSLYTRVEDVDAFAEETERILGR